jgi:hypothetical protein
MIKKLSFLLGCALLGFAAQTTALSEEAYLNLRVFSLKFTDGSLPREPEAMNYRSWVLLPTLRPYVVLDGEGEAYIDAESAGLQGPFNRIDSTTTVDLRISKGKEITGRLFVPRSDLVEGTILKFRADPSSGREISKEEFFKAKEAHYRHLRERNLPGSAWLRHQENEAAKAAGTSAVAVRTGTTPNWRQGAALDGDFDSTFELFSGGRAISENLQLNRGLALTATNESTVDLASLRGITVREMDWNALIKEQSPELDTLAKDVPFDQHALFFPSFEALTAWIDEADSDGTPVLQYFEPRSEDSDSRGRYQRQLCLELNDLSRLLGPKVISSAVFTGSDPYLRTGTDIGILYETKSPGILKMFIMAKHTLALQTNTAVKAVKGEIEGIAYSGVVSADRKVSSYVAALDDVVLVSNSSSQLGRILQVIKGKGKALASQPDYVYFRTKYPRNEKTETGFLVLPDAAIRRWCGPQWRIANSRRTRAAATMAEIQAAYLEKIVSGQITNELTVSNSPEVGEIKVTPAGVISSQYGTLEFLTPIAEMLLTQVTKAEADAYTRWRNGYQQNWSQFFDPIAIRFSIGQQQLGAEISVMPLIARTDYQHFIGLASGAEIAAEAGDRHDALFHMAMSINTSSEMVKQSGNFLGGFSPSLRANPLGWMGQSVAVYADSSPFWEDLKRSDNPSTFLEHNYPLLPVGVQFEVKSGLGVVAFLAAVRGFVEQTAPRMTTWENLEYQEHPYVKVTSRDTGFSGGMTNLAVYYSVTPKSLVLTLSESLLKRALDRQASPAQAKPASDEMPWFGKNLCLQLRSQFASALEAVFYDHNRSSQQLLAWNNLPILNEWKRLYPERDPVKLHEQLWQTKLLCPGDGHYVWNAKWQTMESSVYGHPGEPRQGPKTNSPLAQLSNVNLGLTFENQGLSAKTVFMKKE